VVAADDQRRRLALALRDGPERHLARVAELVAEGGPEIERQLAASRAELDELARGIRPALLTEHGIGAALDELATRSDCDVAVAVPDERYPPALEAAVYFVCSEALANVAKHAHASHVSVAVARQPGRLRLELGDDGVGGAAQASGSGLRGLVDRVEALDGTLTIVSPAGAGTRIVVEVPLP
jgi:signal transduction histidine kinase